MDLFHIWKDDKDQKDDFCYWNSEIFVKIWRRYGPYWVFLLYFLCNHRECKHRFRRRLFGTFRCQKHCFFFTCHVFVVHFSMNMWNVPVLTHGEVALLVRHTGKVYSGGKRCLFYISIVKLTNRKLWVCLEMAFFDKCFWSSPSCGDSIFPTLTSQYECPRLSLLIITSIPKTN